MKKKRIKTRDWNLVRIIQGATKAAVHTDKKKEENRKACRGEVEDDDTDSFTRLAPILPETPLASSCLAGVDSASQKENDMQAGSVVFHKRLDKGPGTVVEVWTDETGRFAKVFWQRDLLVLDHPALSLMLGVASNDQGKVS